MRVASPHPFFSPAWKARTGSVGFRSLSLRDGAGTSTTFLLPSGRTTKSIRSWSASSEIWASTARTSTTSSCSTTRPSTRGRTSPRRSRNRARRAGPRTLALDLSADPALQGSGSFDLAFSLELIRIGTAEASMSVSIDNVSLTAEQYANGSFTGAPIDAGSATRFSAAVVQATADPPATSVAVETRTGNASLPGDPSWTAWAPAAGSQIASPPNRFLQWRLSFGTDGAGTPVVTRLSIRADAYRPVGILRTASFLPAESVFGWESLFVNENRPSGTAIVYEMSVDGGASWIWVVDGQDLSRLATKPLVLRMTLSSGNTSVSPSVTSVAVSYRPSMW